MRAAPGDAVPIDGSINRHCCKGAVMRWRWRERAIAGILPAWFYLLRRAAPHCMVVNLVRSGRKQPQLFSASAGGTARHPPSSGTWMPAVLRFRWFGPLVLMVLGLSAMPARALDGVTFEGQQRCRDGSRV